MNQIYLCNFFSFFEPHLGQPGLLNNEIGEGAGSVKINGLTIGISGEYSNK